MNRESSEIGQMKKDLKRADRTQERIRNAPKFFFSEMTKLRTRMYKQYVNILETQRCCSSKQAWNTGKV